LTSFIAFVLLTNFWVNVWLFTCSLSECLTDNLTTVILNDIKIEYVNISLTCNYIFQHTIDIKKFVEMWIGSSQKSTLATIWMWVHLFLWFHLCVLLMIAMILDSPISNTKKWNRVWNKIEHSHKIHFFIMDHTIIFFIILLYRVFSVFSYLTCS